MPETYPGSLNDFRVVPSPWRAVIQANYRAQPVRIAIRRLIACLEEKYEIEGNEIVVIENIIQIIQDKELKQRCLDLLSADGNFDRVIREATTILEDRKNGILLLDGEPYEQEGFSQLYRGVMLSLRDETHRKLIDRFTREDAFKTLAFIDILLETLKRNKRRESPI